MYVLLWIVIGALASDSVNSMEKYSTGYAWFFRIIIAVLIVGTVIERKNRNGGH